MAKEAQTTYGKFLQTNYSPVYGLLGRKIGMNMVMEFQPEDRVIDAKKIGFIQAVKTWQHGTPDRDLHVDKSNYAIDQLSTYRNPLYATSTVLTDGRDTAKEKAPNKSSADLEKKLEGYKGADVHDAKFNSKETDNFRMLGRKKAGYGDFGSRVYDPAQKKFVAKNAQFQDTPHILGIPKDSGETFETTALVVDGWQTGLYLGSVTWGWEKKGRDFSFQEMTLKSKEAPSEVFFGAASAWNKKEGIKTPMSEGKIKVDKAKLFANESDVTTATVKKELAIDKSCRIVKQQMINGESYLYIISLDPANNSGKKKDIPLEGWVREKDVNSDVMFTKINNPQP